MIGNRVKDLRKQRGLSLNQLAERSGVAKSYLSSLERDIQTNPSIQVLEKLANVLHVPVERLLGQEAEEPDLDEVDAEWFDLVKEAMASGVDKQQFREFLEFNKWRKRNKLPES